MYVDSHAHLTSKQLLSQADVLALRAQQAGVEAIINICTDVDSLQQGLALAERCPWVYNSAATTPHDVATEGDIAFDTMAAAARAGLLVAVGETGLDYYYDYAPQELQRHFLQRYLLLALECKLPVVIHCREAFSDLFSILDTHYIVEGIHGPGVLHCFTGSIEEAKELIARGWYISFSGIVTFKKSELLRAIVEAVPVDRLLIETDAPYLAPQSRRGKLNEPAFLPEIAETLAAVKNLSCAAIAAATSSNARTLFRLPPLKPPTF